MATPVWSTLSDVEVTAATEKAVLITWNEHGEDFQTWVPRSVCQDGDMLDIGHKDLTVKYWFVEKEGLPHA